MSGAFPISTSKFETLGIQSQQSTLISKSMSGKKLTRHYRSLPIFEGQNVARLYRLFRFVNHDKQRVFTFQNTPRLRESKHLLYRWRTFARNASAPREARRSSTPLSTSQPATRLTVATISGAH